MLPTILLPRGVRLSDARDRVRDALEEFDDMYANKYALGYWLNGAYRRALAAGVGGQTPFTVHLPSNLEVSVLDARRALAQARERAKRSDGSLVEGLPHRVHIVRIKDERGEIGFAPIDVRGATLTARVLSVLLADYLMRPEDYVDDTRAA